MTPRKMTGHHICQAIKGVLTENWREKLVDWNKAILGRLGDLISNQKAQMAWETNSNSVKY